MFGLNNFITAGKFFLVIAGELILIFVAVSFIIGLLMEYLPPSRVRDFLSNKFTWVQYFLGAGLGALTPFCSCSTVPITAGLLKGGVPFGPTMAFLFSSPVLNPSLSRYCFHCWELKSRFFMSLSLFLAPWLWRRCLSRLGMERQVKPLVNIEASCCATETNSDTALKSSACGSRLLFLRNTQPITLITLPTIESSCCTTNLDTVVSLQAPFKEKLNLRQ